MLSVNKKSHMLGYVMILLIFGAPKSYAFKKTSKRCSIDSTLQVELKKKKSHVRSHVRSWGSCSTKVKREERQRF